MIEAFNDVPRPIESLGNGQVNGQDVLTNINTMQIGQGSQVFRGDQSGIWLGAATFADAPFSVDMSGAVIATSLSLSGVVESVGGTYTSTETAAAAKVKLLPDANTGMVAYASDGTSKVFEILIGGTNVGDVTLGNYSGGAGVLWDQSAGTFNIKGSMTAGSITIGTNAFHVDTSGNMWWGSSSTYAGATIKISAAGAVNFTTGTFSGTLSAAAGTLGTITAGTITSSSQISVGGIAMVGNGIAVDNTQLIAFKDTGGNLDGTIQMSSGNLFSVLNLGGKAQFGSTDNDVILKAHNAEVLLGDSDGKIRVNSPIIVGGVDKSAIVPVKDGYRALYCMESPEVWFMDIANSKDNIDPMFNEVTTGEKEFIKTESGKYLVFAKRKGHENKRFELKTEKEYHSNNDFWSTPFK
jgi:hypothetical protein